MSLALGDLPEDTATKVAHIEVQDKARSFNEDKKHRGYTPEKLSRSEIKDLVENFLHQCGFVETTTDTLSDYAETCTSAWIARGLIAPEDNSVRSHIPLGSTIGCLAYGHHEDEETKLYISLHMTLIAHLDDTFERYIDAMKEFNVRFMTGQPQKHACLDRFAAFLSTTSSHFNAIDADLIVTTTLNFITALLLEHELKGIELEKSAISYLPYARDLDSATQAYALFIFPRRVPLKAYIHAVPDIMFFIKHTNDILSFYKEEMAGEQSNYVTMLAKCRDSHQSVILRDLTNDIVATHHRILETLKPSAPAYAAYVSFAQGYIAWHCVASRYRLFELTM